MKISHLGNVFALLIMKELILKKILSQGILHPGETGRENVLRRSGSQKLGSNNKNKIYGKIGFPDVLHLIFPVETGHLHPV